MILLGVLSKYTWGDFLTFLFAVDGVVLAFGFALNKFVWSKDTSLTKTEQRSQREEDKDEDNVDYRKLSEAASDYNEIKSIDDDFDSEEDNSVNYQEESYVPASHTSDIGDSLGREEDSNENGESEEGSYEAPPMDDDDEPTEVSDEDIEENNNLAQQEFLSDQEDAEIVTSNYEDGNEDESNVEYLGDDDQEPIYANQQQDEALTNVVIVQDGVSVDDDGPSVLNDDEYDVSVMEDITSASPKDFPSYPMNDDMDDPTEESSPTFDD